MATVATSPPPHRSSAPPSFPPRFSSRLDLTVAPAVCSLRIPAPATSLALRGAVSRRLAIVMAAAGVYVVGGGVDGGGGLHDLGWRVSHSEQAGKGGIGC